MADRRRAGRLSRGRRRDGGPRRRHRRRPGAPSWSGCWSIPRSTPPAPAARHDDLLDPRFPLFTTGRGGQLTYHGPGQRVAYVMLDLKRRRPDVRAYVAGLEEWIIRTLAAFNVRGERREDRVGVWVKRPDKGAGHEDKIAAIGVRLRRWVSFHGIAINVEPDLSHFSAIVPCGVADPAIWRHLAGRSRPPRHDGRCRRRAPAGFCGGVRAGRGASCRKRRCIDRLRRRALRRDLELAGDVAALLGQAAKAVGIALDLVDMRVALLVQRPEQFAHALEDRGEIGGLLVLGVGALADMDVEPEAGEALFGQRFAAGEPVGGIDRFDDDGGDLGILAQDSAR